MIFSYTLIDTFHNTCPRQAYERWWNKIPVPASKEMDEGKRVHKHLENRLGLHKPVQLPAELQHLEPICQSIEGRGSPTTELKVAVNRNLEHSGFFDKDTYCRGVLDVLLRGQTSAAVFDWKTGKNREGDKEPLQLMLSAAYVLTELKHIDSVMAANIYTKTGQLGQAHTWTRAELPGIWRTIVPLIDEIEQAERQGPRAFMEKPSGLCGWCPVFACQHNRTPR
jgi:hypothetical protein